MEHPTSDDVPWHDFIKGRLLAIDCGLTGVAVLTKKGVCVYTHGKLANDEKQDWSELTTVFRDNEEGTVSKLSLVVDNERVQFIPFKTTLSSVYGISAGDKHRLIICSFPLGVLVCVNEPPTPMSNAVTAVENFCSSMRT